MAARITATPQVTGEGTPKSGKPGHGQEPLGQRHHHIACRTPFTVLPRWSKIWASWASEKGETGRSSARSRAAVAQQEEQHEENKSEVEGGGGEAGHRRCTTAVAAATG